MKTSKKNNINKALSISVISLFILVFCFWARAQAKNTITSELESPAGQTYPIEPTSNEDEGLYQTYPLEPPPTAESTLVIPTDQIVGITNTGRIIEVPQEVIDYVIVIPGYNINSSMPIPFGSCNGYEYYVLSPWFFDNQPMEFDYGFIHLDCTIGHQSGYLEFSPYDDPGTGKFLQLVGYPQDKDLLYGREMWFSLGYLLYSEPLFTFYDNDTYYGESGAPVWEIGNSSCYHCVLAIHSGGFDSLNANGGPRVAEAFLYYLQQEQTFIVNLIYLPFIVLD